MNEGVLWEPFFSENARDIPRLESAVFKGGTREVRL